MTWRDRPRWHYAVLVVVAVVAIAVVRHFQGASKVRHTNEQADLSLRYTGPRVQQLAAALGAVTADREVPCVMPLGQVPVGQKTRLAWLGAGSSGPRPDAPGSQSWVFNHATDIREIVGAVPAVRAHALNLLLDSTHVAIAVPTTFVQAERTAEAPGFVGGRFEGYLVVVGTGDRKVLCSAKLDVQITDLGASWGRRPSGAVLDETSNFQAWDQLFQRHAGEALRRIGGPNAGMAD